MSGPQSSDHIAVDGIDRPSIHSSPNCVQSCLQEVHLKKTWKSHLETCHSTENPYQLQLASPLVASVEVRSYQFAFRTQNWPLETWHRGPNHSKRDLTMGNGA